MKKTDVRLINSEDNYRLTPQLQNRLQLFFLSHVICDLLFYISTTYCLMRKTGIPGLGLCECVFPKIYCRPRGRSSATHHRYLGSCSVAGWGTPTGRRRKKQKNGCAAAPSVTPRETFTGGNIWVRWLFLSSVINEATQSRATRGGHRSGPATPPSYKLANASIFSFF